MFRSTICVDTEVACLEWKTNQVHRGDNCSGRVYPKDVSEEYLFDGVLPCLAIIQLGDLCKEAYVIIAGEHERQSPWEGSLPSIQLIEVSQIKDETDVPDRHENVP